MGDVFLHIFDENFYKKCLPCGNVIVFTSEADSKVLPPVIAAVTPIAVGAAKAAVDRKVPCYLTRYLEPQFGQLGNEK